ncbi:hypothetical protein AR687_15880 [Flavobacteriaceae bacterium CRH]|nr:hypothetical protein AR687_15880 [Flavobacteriaceae bacterium CRH]
MNYTALKINEIAIEYFSDNNSKFAKAMNTSEANIRNYRNGTLPKIDFIIKLCETLEINFEWFLVNKGTKNRTIEIDNIRCHAYSLNQNKLPTIVNNESRENIALVAKNDHARYLKNYNNIEFIKKLKFYNIPRLNSGIYRMFQVSGHDMYPTLHDSSYIVGEWVENWSTDITDDKIYIIVSLAHGILVKRVLNRIQEFGNLYCKSDNRTDYPSFEIDPKDILEIWAFKMHLSFELSNPINLQQRVNDLESKLIFLENKIK